MINLNSHLSIFREEFALRHDVIFIISATAIGVFIRAYFLVQPMRYDEAFMFLNFVNSGIASLFYYPLPNNHVLHTLLVEMSTSIFGAHPISIRIPAFLAGIASIPLIFIVCRKLINKRAGLISAIAMATLPYLILYSTNARGYSLLTFLSLLLAFIGMQIAENPTLKGYILVSLVGALGMITMPSMLFVNAGVYLWICCLLYFNKQSIADILVKFLVPCTVMTFVFTLIFYSPTIVVSGGIGSIVANRFVQSSPWEVFIAQLYPHVRNTFINYTRDVHVLVVYVFLLFLVVGALLALKKRNWSVISFLPSILLGSSVILFASHRIPFDRTWIYLIPFFLIVSAYGFTHLVGMVSYRVRSLIHIFMISSVLFYSIYLMSGNVIVKYPDTGSFPEAPLVVKFLRTKMDSNDKYHVRTPANYPTYFYIWYFNAYSASEEKQNQAATETRDNYFIVKTNRYSIDQMTNEKVSMIFNFKNAVIYKAKTHR